MPWQCAILENSDLKETQTVSDEELLEYLRATQPHGLDGIWNAQTLQLAQRFGTTKLNINRWWCLTPSEWMCPACDRPKSNIVRINQHGELICHLIEHHDHMDRYVQDRLVEYIGKLPALLATIDSDQFARRCSRAFAAFDPTVVCVDCNNIDSAAKRRVHAHRYFSFTIRDIRQIAIVRPNQPHALDEAVLKEIWPFRERQLQTRCDLIDRLVELAATNEHWYEQANRASHADRAVEVAKFFFETMKPLHWGDMHISRFEQASVVQPSRSSNLRGWRKRKRLKAKQPPNAQEVKWVAEASHSGHYVNVPDDWICPWCKRTKFQIIRPSKQFKWSFAISDLLQINPETGHELKIAICHDCQSVRLQIAKEANTKPNMIRAADVASIIDPRPHAQHELRANAEVDAVVRAIIGRDS